MAKNEFDILEHEYLRQIKTSDNNFVAYLLKDDLRFFNKNLKNADFGKHIPISFKLNGRLFSKSSKEILVKINPKIMTKMNGDTIERKIYDKNMIDEKFCEYLLQDNVKIEDVFKVMDTQTPYIFSESNVFTMFEKLVTKHIETGVEFVWREKNLTHEDSNCLALTNMRECFDYFNGMKAEEIRFNLIDLLEDVFKRECQLNKYTKTIEQTYVACSLDQESPFSKKKKPGRKK
jgi:hypothetical protein